MKPDTHHALVSGMITTASLALLDLLPETDVVCEVKTLLEIQHDIMISLLKKKHYGLNKLTMLEEQCALTLQEAERLKNGQRLY